MNTTPATAATILATDQNSQRQIVWTVLHSAPLPASWSKGAWTHTLFVARRNGAGAAHSMQVEIDPGTGQVIRNSTARRI